MHELKKWAFIISAADRPGVMTSVASVFSGRGLQVEAIMGNGGRPGNAELTVIFEALESRKESMFKLIGRLENVHHVEAHDCTSDTLLRCISVKVEPEIHVSESLIPVPGHSGIYTFTGTYSEVESILDNISVKLISWHLVELK